MTYKRDIADGWRHLPFNEAVLLNPTVRLERGVAYSFVSMADISADTRSVYPSEQRTFRSGGSRFQNGDTLMARITPCLENGKIARYHAKDATEAAHGSTEFIVIRGRPEVTDNDFAYYLTRWDKVRNYAITQMTGTSGRQRVPINSLEHLIVPIPPLPKQRRIAHILGTLDDKIALNRRMNETLEEMARALFKAWFINFEPVRAKIEGRWRRGESLPGMPAELYDLFPDRLVDSELGAVPEGWAVGTVGECFNLTMGQSPPGSTYNEEGDGMSFFQGSADFDFRYPTNRRYCTAPARIAEPDDTLVSVRAPVGTINMAWEKCCIGRGLAALRHKSGCRSFTYYAVNALQREIQQYEHTGTVFGAINKRQFETLPTLEPPTVMVDAFGTFALNWDERIRLNTAENRTLATMRDTLLPKLISGEFCSRGATNKTKE